MRRVFAAVLFGIVMSPVVGGGTESVTILGEEPVYVYSGPESEDVEWSEFSSEKFSKEFERKFSGGGEGSYLLEIHQRDVKQDWRVFINDAEVGKLVRDENPMVIYLPVDGDVVGEGENRLRIVSSGTPRDDISIRKIVLYAGAIGDVVGKGTVRVSVSAEGKSIPCRITVLNESGEMQTVGAASNGTLAVRPGTVYTSTGRAEFGLPAGRYTVFAGRGFEYSLDSKDVELSGGDQAEVSLSLRREVSTPGYVACDTHVHTLTDSGHGDCMLNERMITIAGEGIELADHNGS